MPTIFRFEKRVEYTTCE